jgi:protein involved in polysaccharide export with SLBB domain
MDLRVLSSVLSIRSGIRVSAFFIIPLIVTLLLSVNSRAQNLDLGNLSELKRQYQELHNGSNIQPTIESQQPQSITLQPAVPSPPFTNVPSRLEMIMSSRAHVKLTQFGYDQLGIGRAVTVPQAGAVQGGYVLGPGDELVISLRGQENTEVRAVIDRNGQVALPRLNPLSAMGRTLDSFRQELENAVHRAYVATNAFVTVSRLRQISVLVSGEVNNPGQRLVTGLSSVVDALLLSGGVKKTGSLRNIRVQRGNTVRTVDLYSVLTDVGSASVMRLADGDRIIVPPLGKTVAVSGLVRRPGIFEMAPGQSSISVRQLLALAGGQEVRGNYRLSVMRIRPDGQSQLVPVTEQGGGVQDSEILFVQLGADQTVSQATLAGGTSLAGNYPVTSGTKLSAILNAPGALGTSPYTPFGIIIRKDPRTLSRQLEAFTPVAVLNGREDQVLQSDDVVRVLSVSETRLLNFVVRSYLTQLAEDQNRIRNPLGASSDVRNSLVNQLQEQDRQVAELADLSSVPSNIQRKDITALLDVPAPDSRLARARADQQRRILEDRQARQLATQNGGLPSTEQGQQQFSGSNPGAVPGVGQGTGQVPGGYGAVLGSGQMGNYGQNLDYGQSSGYYEQGAVDYGNDANYDNLGNPNFPPFRDRHNHRQFTQNYTEQQVPPGGYASNREVQTFGQLARQLNVDPLVLVNFLIDHRVQLDGAVHGPGSYFAGPNATLDDLVQAAGGTLNWADESGVELISTVIDRGTGQAVTGRKNLPLHEGMLASYVVHPRDQFRFSQVSSDVGVGSVTVQGEVRYPGTFPILRGEHLSDLLARAGGLTSTAYPYGTVYLRQSAAQAERQAYIREADEIQNQLVVAMTRIGSSKIDPNTFASMQSFVSEVRNHRALGRVSFIADPRMLVADPSRDPLLEAGDVIYIPPRPTTIAVLGEVLQPGNFTYRKGATLEDYIAQAGGYSAIADESHTYVVLPNGEARRVTRSWLNFEVTDLPAGSSIVIPRDVTPLDLRQTIIDVSQIFSQFAVSIASIAVLSRQ